MCDEFTNLNGQPDIAELGKVTGKLHAMLASNVGRHQ
jgi:hypothetical protein